MPATCRFFALLLLVALVAHPGDLAAQPRALTGYPTPLVNVLGPAGGKAGATVEVALTGQNLVKPQGLLLDSKALDVEWLPTPKPASPPPRNAPPTQTVVARFKIPADAAIGLHDLRLVGHWGVSNPRAFAVGDQEQAREQEPNNDVEQAQEIPLGCSVDGVVSTPTDVDYYQFAGKKGQRVVLVCLASSLDSRLTPSIQLYTQGGSPLGFARDYRGSDAVLDAVLPADGTYLVRLFAFTYTQGSAEHFYRLTVSTAPWIDAVYPPVVEPGKTATLTIHGRNLPGGQIDPTATLDGRALEKLEVKVTAPADPAVRQRLDVADAIPPHMATVDGFPLQLRNAAGKSNAYLVQYASAPVVLEQGDNDRAEQAQAVSVPCEVAGRFEKIRDRDWYRFAARKGQALTIDIRGDRLGSPLDMYAFLKSADGKTTLAELDDNPELLHPLSFFSRTDDPARYKFVPPADGDYLLLVSSREADIQGGPRGLYSVRIAPEQPDFRAVLQSPVRNSPDETALRAGTAVAFNLYVVPSDGFNAPLTLEARGLPPGVSLATPSLPAGARTASVAFTATPEAREWAGTFTLLARAAVGGKELVREVRCGSIVWGVPPQQNVPTVARLANDCVLAVREAPPFKVEPATTRLVLLPGETAELPVKVVALDKSFTSQVAVGPLLPPGNRNNLPVAFNNNGDLVVAPGTTGRARVQAGNNAPPGLHTLQLRGQTTLSLIINPETGEKGRGNIPIPAVPVQVLVLPKQVATARVTGGDNVRLKVGEKAALSVKIERSPLFTGPVAVEVVVPEAARGLLGSKATVAADKDEATLSLEAVAGAATGARPGLVVRLTAELEGKKFTQDVRLTVTVQK